MDNKNDKYYLDKILEDLEFVITHCANKTKEELVKDEVLIDSILFRIIQISENNGKLSDDFKDAHRHIPWASIKGMRNQIVHNYGNVDLSIVYDTATRGMVQMHKLLKAIK